MHSLVVKSCKILHHFWNLLKSASTQLVRLTDGNDAMVSIMMLSLNIFYPDYEHE